MAAGTRVTQEKARFDACSQGCPNYLENRLVISDLDIWRAANLLIQRHGANAEIEAAKRADQMLERGDLDGHAVWKQIMRAIVALQAPAKGPLN
jgi:hypothetical protein